MEHGLTMRPTSRRAHDQLEGVQPQANILSAPAAGCGGAGNAALLSKRVLESEQQLPHCAEIAAGCPLVRGIELCSAQDVPACTRTLLPRHPRLNFCFLSCRSRVAKTLDAPRCILEVQVQANVLTPKPLGRLPCATEQLRSASEHCEPSEAKQAYLGLHDCMSFARLSADPGVCQLSWRSRATYCRNHAVNTCPTCNASSCSVVKSWRPRHKFACAQAVPLLSIVALIQQRSQYPFQWFRDPGKDLDSSQPRQHRERHQPAGREQRPEARATHTFSACSSGGIAASRATSLCRFSCTSTLCTHMTANSGDDLRQAHTSSTAPPGACLLCYCPTVLETQHVVTGAHLETVLVV